MGKLNAADARAAYEPLMRDVRGCRVLLDRDAAKYFEVELKTLRSAVTRNSSRFPADCMIEFRGDDALRLGRRAFTEVGVNLLASVLNSKRAVAHSIAIIEEGIANYHWIRAGRS